MIGVPSTYQIAWVGGWLAISLTPVLGVEGGGARWRSESSSIPSVDEARPDFKLAARRNPPLRYDTLSTIPYETPSGPPLRFNVFPASTNKPHKVGAHPERSPAPRQNCTKSSTRAPRACTDLYGMQTFRDHGEQLAAECVLGRHDANAQNDSIWDRCACTTCMQPAARTF